MNIDNILDLARIAAGHHHGYGQAGGGAGIKDELIAACEAVFGQGQPAQRITFERVRAGQVDYQLGFRPRQPAETPAQCVEVGVVARAVIEGDVQVAVFLAEREVLRRRGSRR